MSKVHEVIIAGSGIAGLSAAIYSARADLAPIVIDGNEPGGQLTLTTDVENYLGFPEGVGGTDLVMNGREQAERFGAEFHHGLVEAVDTTGDVFDIRLTNGDTYRTKALIVATGASARTLGVPGEDALMGNGLSTCATCDGAFHRGDDLLVVGGGDSAMEEALFLTKFADSVTVAHRREELRASEIMANRAFENDKIDFRWNTEVTEIHGSEEAGVTGATVVSHPDGHPKEKQDNGVEVTEERLDLGGLFYAIGHVPNTGFLEETPVVLDDRGYIQTADSEYETMTHVPGIFAAGDVMDPVYQQAITAGGFGTMASLDVEGYLEDRAAAERAETVEA